MGSEKPRPVERSLAICRRRAPMEPPDDRQRQSELAQIHQAARALGMDPEARSSPTPYRHMLREVAGVDSAAELDAEGRRRVLEHLRRLAAEGLRGGAAPHNPGVPPGKKSIVSKIRATWFEMHREGIVHDSSVVALDRWVQRMTRRFEPALHIERVTELEHHPAIAIKVLEELKQWRKRVLQERKS